ncbi:MAG: exonuclease domain-containing protein [Clostridia bacterium]|nr:exonuclease domain-containing protein [Clostridia bacterium]
MKYIFLDLEWNSAYCKRKEKFVNEIIEIGAVKLDNRLQVEDTFAQTVKSQLTKRLASRFKNLTNISNLEMRQGISFSEALSAFRDWCGDDFILLTWSNSDIYALIENCRLFSNCGMLRISKYVDFQKYVQNELRISGKEITNQISLLNAAMEFGLNTESFAFHRALDDSMVCVEILKRCYHPERFATFIIDTEKDDYFDRLTYKAYIITDIKSPLIDGKELQFRCKSCGNYAKRISPWVFKSPYFFANFRCKNCGLYFTGRITFKKHYDHVSVKRYSRIILKSGQKNNEK